MEKNDRNDTWEWLKTQRQIEDELNRRSAEKKTFIRRICAWLGIIR